MNDNTSLSTPNKEDDQKKLREPEEKNRSTKNINGVLISKANNKALPNKNPPVHNKAHSKKAISPGRIRKHKATTSPTKSHLKSKKKDISESAIPKENKGSFYQGAIVGSFLGAAVTTVLSNLAVKAFQN
ncbi:pheromone-regulated protein PRM3 [Saccharomyces eubayanus]|uniref:pheromone-regulated protein PRM3 n=1 Tax=Saccharomyces eubayanus TaxID=1080349 RepID=UPI0006BFCE28|nr:PRM3-like protein [Saccharomyces eubayanus]KOG96127.1 PRM3-like protein [Saccharomyces eubayanus]